MKTITQHINERLQLNKDRIFKYQYTDFEYEYDYTIKNYGDLSDLVVECIGFLDYMKEREPYVDVRN